MRAGRQPDGHNGRMAGDDTYTGQTEVGGPADVRRLPALTITKLAVGGMDNNAYLLSCNETGERLLVDAAAEPDRLLELVSDRAPERILTTHRHRDHWQALAQVADTTGAATLAGENDAAGIDFRTDETLADGDVLRLGDCELEVIELVGHTPGSIALRYDDPHGISHVWTGDSLFPGGVGKTGSEQDFTRLVGDVETKLFDRLDDSAWFYPGHGNDSTIGAERPGLPQWKERGW